MQTNPCQSRKCDKVNLRKKLRFLLKKVSGLLKGVSDKLGTLKIEIETVSNSSAEMNCKKSFSEMFKDDIKHNSLPLLNQKVILSKLEDFSNADYFIKHIRDFGILFLYKWLLRSLLKPIAPAYVMVILFEGILAMFCGFNTRLLYHIYVEIPNNKMFDNKDILNAIKVSIASYLVFKAISFIGYFIVLKYLLLIIVEYLIVLVLFTAISIIYQKFIYLLR